MASYCSAERRASEWSADGLVRVSTWSTGHEFRTRRPRSNDGAWASFVLLRRLYLFEAKFMAKVRSYFGLISALVRSWSHATSRLFGEATL